MDDKATLLNTSHLQPLHTHLVGLQTLLRDGRLVSGRLPTRSAHNEFILTGFFANRLQFINCIPEINQIYVWFIRVVIYPVSTVTRFVVL